VLPEDKFFQTNDEKKIWERYCGFLDLTLEEFMQIQQRLLMEQIELVADTPLAKKFMNGNKPQNVEEFRNMVPLTTYEEYEPYFSQQQDEVLAEKPLFWCHSSGRGGKFKWMPYTHRAYDAIAKRCVSIFILSSTEKKGRVNFKPRWRVLFLMAPKPYTSGTLVDYVQRYVSLRVMPPQEGMENIPFPDRAAIGFQQALRTGADTVAAIASVLAKTGERMAEQAQGMQFSWNMLNPPVFYRLISAWARSKRDNRPILPKDLWPTKGIVVGGTDARIYKDAITRYWGVVPFELYVSTEMYIIALQAWNRKWLTFLPDLGFWEFIPQEELAKCKENEGYSPKTVLYNEVEPGHVYEVVGTQFYGIPLLRYRMGDLVKFVALKDEDAGINLPQAEFKTKISDTIDLGGLTDLDEVTIWTAIENCAFKYEDWSARKEIIDGKGYLSIYLELKEEKMATDLEALIDQQLKAIDVDYRDVETMLGLQPIKVTLLKPGTFQQYYEVKQKEGADLAHLKPPHMNASEEIIQLLLQFSQK